MTIEKKIDNFLNEAMFHKGDPFRKYALSWGDQIEDSFNDAYNKLRDAETEIVNNIFVPIMNNILKYFVENIYDEKISETQLRDLEKFFQEEYSKIRTQWGQVHPLARSFYVAFQYATKQKPFTRMEIK